MKKISDVTLTFLMILLLMFMFAPHTWASLESGVPFHTWVDGKTLANTTIIVPDEATKLIVSISDGSGDLDLYLKYGSPVSGDTISAIDADADIRSDGVSADETIILTPSTTPGLRAGTWHVATLNLNDDKTTLTLTATIEVESPQAIEITENSVNFGSVVMGQTVQKSIQISNDGTSDLVISSIGIKGGDAMFRASHDCTTIHPSEACVINFTFSPTSSGISSTQLNIYSNDPDTPVLAISLTGTGVANIAEELLPLPTGQEFYPTYSPVVLSETGIDPSKCKPVGVGNIANGGDTVSITVGLENPSGPYDAYFAVQSPALSNNEILILGSDGSLYPSSQSGLIKWKHSAEGPINENLFGELPVSSLPGGTYTLYFLLTATNSLDSLTDINSLDSYYLWSSFVEVPESVPDGSAGFFNGSLVVPNATIIYQGDLHEDSAPLAEDGIAAITKDGKTYFYHPAMGQAELSDYNSRKAVGYFMTGMSASEVAAMRSKRSRLSNSATAKATPRSASPTTARVIGVGQTLQLGTDVDIELMNSSGEVTATNSRRRFAAVKTGQDNKNRYFLVPASNTIPTEILDQVNGAIQIYNSNYFSSLNSVRSDIQATDKIETFGSFFRQLPTIIAKGGYSDNQLEAFAKDEDLTNLLNTIDLYYTTLEFTRLMTGVVGIECFDVATSGYFRYLQSYMLDSMTHDMEAKWQLDDVNIRGSFNSASFCISQAILAGSGVLIPAAAILEAYTSFWDIVSVGTWVVDDIAIENLNAIFYGSNDAYDLATIRINDMMAYLGLQDSSGIPQEFVWNMEHVWNMEDGSTWVVPAYTGGYPHQIIGMTSSGVVMSFWDGEPEKIITTMDWGRGTQTDIGSVSKLCEDRNFDPRKLDISDSGRLYFAGSKCWKEVEEARWGDRERTIVRNGIYTVMADGSDGYFVPIVLDQTELNYIGYDNIDIDKLSVSGDGKVLAFSTYNDKTYKYHLYSVDPSGKNLHELASSNGSIDSISINYSGDKIIFDYTTAEQKTVLYAVSTNKGSPFELSTEPGLELFTDSTAISRDGIWVACVGGILSQENSKVGIVFIRSDGSGYHFVDTGNLGILPSSVHPLQFTQNGKSVVFSGGDLTISIDKRLSDIFAVDIDPDDPNLRNLTNSIDTDKQSKMFPVLR